MELFNSALPNVMFLVGIAAISIGLGIELKIVPIANQVTREGRMGAMIMGALLVIGSIFVYLRPSPAPVVATTTAAAVGGAPAGQPLVMQATAVPTVAAATPEPPTATPEPPTATLAPPTATLAPPTATPEPPTATSVPPTATPEPPTAVPATATPESQLPDLYGLSEKDADRWLKRVGLERGNKVDSCAEIGAPEQSVSGKDKIICYALNTETGKVDYVLTSSRGDDEEKEDD